MVAKNTICIWYNKDAEEAAHFYAKTFPDSSVDAAPKGQVKASNITSHKTAGLGAWTDDEIKRVLTHGIGRDGGPLALQMQRQSVLLEAHR